MLTCALVNHAKPCCMHACQLALHVFCNRHLLPCCVCASQVLSSWHPMLTDLLHNQQHFHGAGLIFEALGFFDVGLAVFFGKFDMLAKHLLSPTSSQGATELLRTYLKPVCAS